MLADEPTILEVTKWHAALQAMVKALIYHPDQNAADPNHGHLFHDGWASTTAQWQTVLGQEHPDAPPVANPTTRRPPPPVDQLPAGNAANSTFAPNTTLTFSASPKQSAIPSETVRFTIAPDNNLSAVTALAIIDLVSYTYGVLTTAFLQSKMAEIDTFLFATAMISRTADMCQNAPHIARR